jgi:uncharacterized protein YjiS (DUF1127 family)
MTMTVAQLFQRRATRLRWPLLARSWRAVELWCKRHRQRAERADLDGRLLADIGKSFDDIRRECAKPFWR